MNCPLDTIEMDDQIKDPSIEGVQFLSVCPQSNTTKSKAYHIEEDIYFTVLQEQENHHAHERLPDTLKYLFV